MKKYIINMLLAIVVATTAKAQVPVITTQPQSVTVCKGNTATFSVAASNNPTSYTWQMSINDGETWETASGSSVSFFVSITILPPFGDSILLRSIANNASGSSLPSNAAVLTINKATDSLYIVKPNSTATCVGNSFLLAGSQANGVFSSSNSNVATVNCSGVVNVKTQGTSSIKYIYTSTNGCSDTASYALNSNSPTPATVGGVASLCVGGSTTYTANINDGKWSSLNNRANINSGGVVTGANSGSGLIQYAVTGTNGCVSNTIKTINVVGKPNVPTIQYAAGTVNPQKGAGGAFCTNKTFTVVGTPSGGVWSSTGVITVGSNTGVVNTGSSAGAGSLTYTFTNTGGCSNSRTIIGNVAACAARGVNGTTNEKQETNNEFIIYPNPAKTFIRLNVETLVGAGTIVIIDLYGKQVKTQSLSIGNNTVDIANLSKGMYFANIMVNNTKQVKKIIIE